MPHLYVCVSAHGYGHLAQLAPVLGALHARLPRMRITLQSTVSPSFAAECLPAGFEQIAEPADPVMPMASPLATRWREALELYSDFCRRQSVLLSRQRELLRQVRPDLVLSNVAWLPLLVGRESGIPAVALCSLNWLDILRQGPLGDALDPRVVEQLTAAYQAADLFLRPTPAMPMAWLDRARAIGPVARIGRPSAVRIRQALGLPADTRLAMYQLGGIDDAGMRVTLPRLAGVHWLLQSDCPVRDDCSRIADLPMPFIDVLASCDLMLTKPGYGSVAEAACNGVPVLYVPRGDWPEEPHLLAWLDHELPTAAVSLDALATGDFVPEMERLLARPRPAPVAATGVAEAADLLMGLC